MPNDQNLPTEEPTPEAAADESGNESSSDDKILRTLAQHFLRDLIEILFPKAAPDIDFDAAEFIGGKYFKDFKKKGHVRPDVVVKLPALDGEPKLGLFHAEMEGDYRKSIEERLLTYFHHLSLHFDNVPVLCAAVFVRGGPKSGLEQREIVKTYKGYITSRFYYMAFSLSRSLAEDFLKRPQALAAAFASMMRSQTWDRVELKIRCLEAIQRAQIDPERGYVLYNVVDNYLELDAEEAVRFADQTGAEERQEVDQMIQTLSEALETKRQEGIALGEERGRVLATREAIVLMAQAMQKTLPDDFEAELEAINDIGHLHEILEEVSSDISLNEIDLTPR